MKQAAGAILVLSFLLLVGCASTSIRKSPELHLTAITEWPVLYHRNYSALETMRSKARLTVETPSMANHFTVRFIYASPDTLFMEAEGPLGVNIGKIFIGRQRFIVYNQYDNQFFSGGLDEDYYNTFLETDIRFKQIKNAAIGYVNLPQNLQLVDKKHGIFAARVGGAKWRFEVDVNTGILRSWEISRDGRTEFVQEFKNYRVIDGLLIPGFVRIILPQKKQLMSIFHKDIKLNRPVNPEEYRIEINPKVKQLIVGD